MSDSVSALIDRLIAQNTRRQQAAGAVLPGGLATALQGATFGTGEEATAALRSLFGGTSYEEALAQERANIAQYREQNPVRAAAFEVAGAIPTTVGAALLTPATGGASGAAAAANVARMGGTLARAAQGARAGATAGGVTGALEGFGTGEGGVGERLSGAAGGAVLGAGLGGVVGGVAPAIADRARATYGALRGGTPEAERRLAATMPIDAAQAELLAARQAGNIMPGQPVTLAERFGETGMTAAEALAQAPGATRELAAEVLRPRTGQQTPRIEAGLRVAFGDVEDAAERARAIRANMSGEISPVYERAFASARTPTTGELAVLRYVNPSALKEASEIARSRTGAPLDIRMKDGQLVIPSNITAYDLHQIKLGVDDYITKNSNQITGALTPSARAAIEPRNKIVELIDDLTKVNGTSLYAQARNEWADQAALLNAQKVGLNLFKPSTNPRELREQLKSMGDAEKREFATGVVQAIRDRIAGMQTGRDAARNIIGTQKQRDLLRAAMDAVYPDPKDAEARFKMLTSFLERETTMKGFEGQVLGGSATARRLLGQSLVETGGLTGAGFGAGQLGLVEPTTGVALGALAGGARALRSATGARAQDVMGRQLLSVDPEEQMRLLTRLGQVRQQEMAAQARRDVTYPAAAGAFAGQLPGLLQ